jgi:hypothetical protein
MVQTSTISLFSLHILHYGKKEDIFKNVISHAKSTALFFRQAKYTMV